MLFLHTSISSTVAALNVSPILITSMPIVSVMSKRHWQEYVTQSLYKPQNQTAMQRKGSLRSFPQLPSLKLGPSRLESIKGHISNDNLLHTSTLLLDLVRVHYQVGFHILPLNLVGLHQVCHVWRVPAAALPQDCVQRAQQSSNVVLHTRKEVRKPGISPYKVSLCAGPYFFWVPFVLLTC